MGWGVDTYEAEIAADSIIWELFAKKSAECLNIRNSFITISNLGNMLSLGEDKMSTAIHSSTLFYFPFPSPFNSELKSRGSVAHSFQE